MNLRLFASCAPGIEPLLAQEITDLIPSHYGVTMPSNIEVVAGGVRFDGDRWTLGHALVGLGLAARILVRIEEFTVRHFNEFEKSLGLVDWSKWLRANEPFAVRASSKKSKLYHSGAITERVLRVVQRSLGVPQSSAAQNDTGEGTEEQTPGIVIRLEHDVCTVSLDVSGTPLHRRGYRKNPAHAPLREDLARALVVASGWDGQSPLLDPFCGSGTILIEAAIWATKLPPGWKRTNAIVATPLGNEPDLQAIKSARIRQSQSTSATLFGVDHDSQALEAARANWQEWFGLSAAVDDEEARKFGAVQPSIQWFQQDIRRLAVDVAAATIVTNPPWGDRIYPGNSLVSLYQKLGAVRRSSGTRLALLTSQRELAYKTGVRLHSAFLTDAGGIKANAFVE